jgi:alkylation response protein AidB-like acyl-CoA dehydrogenase
MAQPKDFGFGDDETMLRDSARKFLSENAGIEKLRKLVGDHEEAYGSTPQPVAYDEGLWRQMVDLGWSTLAVPEAAGGAGMKMVAVAALAEEAGRVALPSPLIATLIATCVLRESEEKEASAALERIASGEPASLAATNATGSWAPDATNVVATSGNGETVLSGTAYFVQDARKAAFFVVSARSDAGVGLYVVDADTPGLAIDPDQIVDLTRDQAVLTFDNVKIPDAQIAAAAGSGAAVLTRATPAMLVIVAADQCGAGEWQLQTTAEYAKVRTQFDKPLGFFQAVKHPIVNMMIDVDRAKSLTYCAACAIDSEPDHAEPYARMAKSAAADMAAFCSGRSVQLHGGIGFTWECDVHIYFKRQTHNQMLYGDGVYQRAKLAELM